MKKNIIVFAFIFILVSYFCTSLNLLAQNNKKVDFHEKILNTTLILVMILMLNGQGIQIGSLK